MLTRYLAPQIETVTLARAFKETYGHTKETYGHTKEIYWYTKEINKRYLASEIPALAKSQIQKPGMFYRDSGPRFQRE